MKTTVAAVYEHGSLRLLSPVQLPESSRVQVQIIAPNATEPSEAFARQLVSIHHLLTSLEDEWENDLIREVFLQLLQADLRSLWHLAQPPVRILCAMLQLSARHLQTDTFTHEQIDAIRFVLDQLTTPVFTDNDIRICHERLTATGLPASFSFPAEMIQSYIDEL